MATLMSCATGNWGTSTTWALCNSTSELDSETGYSAVGASWTASSGFTPGAIEVDGIAVKPRTTATPTTGTFSVCIGQSGTPVAGTTVTINSSDLPGDGLTNRGWVFFKFSSPVTLSAATTYTVMAIIVTDGVGLYTNGTTNNWSRQLRTTTTQAAAAGDKLFICGEHTGQGTGNDITVTMNNTDTTDYGTGSTTLPSLSINSRGTLTWGTTASTDYNLRLSGLLVVYPGGTYNMGTTGTPIPSTSSATLEFDCAANVDFGFVASGTVNIQGAPLSYDRTVMTANTDVSATAITVNDSTGWVNGDIIVIAPSRTNRTEYEVRTVNNTSGTTINVTSGLSYPHTGTADIPTEIIHMTRNVNITPVNTTYRAYVCFNQGGDADIDWVGFSYLGSTTGGKRGFEILLIDDIFNVQNCSFYYVLQSLWATGTSQVTSLNYSNNVIYNGYSIIYGTLGSGWTFHNNWFIGWDGSGAHPVIFYSVGGIITNNMVAGYNTYGDDYGAFYLLDVERDIYQFHNNWAHSNNCAGIICTSSGSITNFKTYTMSGTHASFISTYRFGATNLLFENCMSYANSGDIIYGRGEGGTSKVKFRDCTFGSYTGSSIYYFCYFNGGGTQYSFENCNIGATVGNIGDFTNALVFTAGAYFDISFHDCNFGSIKDIWANYPVTTAINRAIIRYSKKEGVEGDDYCSTLTGSIVHNASDGISGTNCMELQPCYGSGSYLNLSNYLDFGMFQCPAQDGVQRNVHIQLKEDGTWNGTDCSIALYQNDILVDGWDTCVLTTDYQEFTLSYTPTEDGVLDMAIRVNGATGSVYADGFRWT